MQNMLDGWLIFMSFILHLCSYRVASSGEYHCITIRGTLYVCMVGRVLELIDDLLLKIMRLDVCVCVCV